MNYIYKLYTDSRTKNRAIGGLQLSHLPVLTNAVMSKMLLPVVHNSIEKVQFLTNQKFLRKSFGRSGCQCIIYAFDWQVVENYVHHLTLHISILQRLVSMQISPILPNQKKNIKKYESGRNGICIIHCWNP